jgi:hypothetical protein
VKLTPTSSDTWKSSTAKARLMGSTSSPTTARSAMDDT